MELDQAALDRFSPKFKELGLSQDKEQALVSLYAEHIQALGEGAGEAFDKAYAERKQAETAEQSEQWLDAVKADKEIGGDKFDGVKSRVIEAVGAVARSEEHTSELQSLMRISYAVFCLKKKKKTSTQRHNRDTITYRTYKRSV